MSIAKTSPLASQANARNSGFTFIELIITVVIVGILASVALPLAEISVKRSKEQELRQALRQIRTAIDEYKYAVQDGRVPRKADESGYPSSLAVLVDGVVDAKDPAKGRIYFLRRMPRDPLFEDRTAPAVQTWGVRSYASPPDDPQPGNDVFDVHSTSGATGLNGVPYREW